MIMYFGLLVEKTYTRTCTLHSAHKCTLNKTVTDLYARTNPMCATMDRIYDFCQIMTAC